MALNPKTRTEYFIAGREGELPIGNRDPETRIEFFLAGREDELPAGHQEPESRLEHFIKDYRSGGDITVIPLTVTNNGDYTAPEGKAYSPVAVNVALPENAYLLKDIPSTPTAIATFADGAEMVMPSLKVAIEPQQEGSGDPSPTNIRPISGWSNCVISVANAITDPTVEHTYTIDLDGTRYGGELDVVNGVLTVDRVGVDMGTLDWKGDASNHHYYTSLNSTPYDKSRGNEIICSCYKNDGGVTTAPYYGDNDTFKWWASPSLAWEIYVTDETEYESIDAFKTAMSGQILCYPLATPLTIQLTPTAVKSLEGTNNVFADSGEILEGEYLGGVS